MQKKQKYGVLMLLTLLIAAICLAAEGKRIEIEGESGKLVPPMAVGADPAASGGQFVHFPHPGTHQGTSASAEEKKGYVELEFALDDGGAYVIEALTYWPHTAEKGVGYGGGQNSFSYRINDSRLSLTLGNDREFNVWKWRASEPTALRKGRNVVRFYCREYNSRLDKIRVVAAETFEVPVPGPAEGLAPWVHYQMLFRSSLGKLVHETIEREQGFNARDDQGLFMSYWIPYCRITGDEEAKRYMYQWRDTFLHAFQNNTGGYYHGFNEVGELHHQTENHQRFLGHLWQIDPKDPKNIAVLEDTAEHVGNWVEGIPPWYDWQNHRFISWWVGTKVVGVQPEWDKKAHGVSNPSRMSLKDALRPITIVLNAYWATGNNRYLQLARDYIDHLCPSLAEKGWRLEAQAQFLESVLMDLHEATDDKKYLAWTKESLKQSLPWAFESGKADEELPRLWRYRRLSGDMEFDQQVLQYAARALNTHFAPIVFMVLGGRGDRELPFPAAFALAGQIADNEQYFAKAFQAAAEHVEGARKALATRQAPFTDLGDHNRATRLMWYTLNGVYPLLGMRPGFWGQNVGGFDVELRSDGGIGVPEGVAVLCRRTLPEERVVTLCNTTDKPVELAVLLGCTGGRDVIQAFDQARQPVQALRDEEGRYRINLQLAVQKTVTLHVELSRRD